MFGMKGGGTAASRLAGSRVARSAGRFAGDARGATAVEYAMVAALVFVLVAGGIRQYGSKLDSIYARIGVAVTQSN